MPERCLIDLCEVLEQNPNIIIVPIGDNQQCASIENPKYDWLKCDIIHHFVDKIIYKEYIPQSARFSTEVLHLIRLLEQRNFKEFKKIILTKNPDGSFKYANNDIYSTKWHICKYRNATFTKFSVPKINKKLCPKIKKGNWVICDKKFETNQVNHNNSLVKENKKQLKIISAVGEKYQVIDTRDKGLKVKLAVNDYGEIKYGWFPLKYNGTTHFSPANASTCFREQGREITEPYIIHDAWAMTLQELIVAISRGKCKQGTLFTFSNIEKITHMRAFPCAYERQTKHRKIPGRYADYTEKNKNMMDKPARNEYEKKLLYIITDANNGKYVGETYWNEKLSIEKNLARRLKGHLDKDKPKDKLSPVLNMTDPVMKPFYDEMSHFPSFIYGKYLDILRIEKNHIRLTMFECKKAGTTYYNRKGTDLKPELNQDKLKQYNILDKEIEKMIDTFYISSIKRPTKKDPNKKAFRIKNTALKDVLKKGVVEKRKFQDIQDIKEKAIAELCCCSVEQVQNIRNKMLQAQPNENRDVLI